MSAMYSLSYFLCSKEHLPFVLDTFHPDLVLYDAGVDPHYSDALGFLKMTDNGISKFNWKIYLFFDLARFTYNSNGNNSVTLKQ